MGSSLSVAVCTGLLGLDMSSTATPCEEVSSFSALIGYSSAVS